MSLQMRLEISRFLILILVSQKAPGSVSEVTQLIQVKLGHNATLSCVARSSSIKAVEWTRPDLKYPEYVLFYSDGHPDKTHQNPSFLGRVELTDTHMRNGNLTVVLRNVSESDNGMYECRVSAKRSKRAIIQGVPVKTIKLQVIDSGSNNGDEINGNPKDADDARGHVVSGVCLGLLICGVISIGWKYIRHKTKKSDLSAADEAVDEQLV